MQPRRLFRKACSVGWLVHGGCGIVVISATCLAVVMLVRIDVEAKSTGLLFAAARLEQAVGYGGLIHNFKNAVLRGAGEPGYFEAAVADVEQALNALDQVDRIQNELQLGASLGAQRDAIAAYQGRLEDVAAMHAAGVRPAEIDAAVRYDDTAALQSVADLHTLIAEAIDSRLLLLQIAGTLLTVAVLAGVVLAFAGPTIVRLRHRNRDLEAFTALAANDLLGPLRRIRAMSQLVAADATGQGHSQLRLHTTARALYATATSLDRALSGTLDHMRMGRPGTPREVDLADLLTTLGHLSVPPPAELILREPMPVIEARVPEIEIVLRHLLDYAVERHPDRAPRIEVGYGRHGGGHRITITATGGSWHEADRHVPRDVTRPGMWLLQSIVDDWGGSVQVDRHSTDGVEIVLAWPL